MLVWGWKWTERYQPRHGRINGISRAGHVDLIVFADSSLDMLQNGSGGVFYEKGVPLVTEKQVEGGPVFGVICTLKEWHAQANPEELKQFARQKPQ